MVAAFAAPVPEHAEPARHLGIARRDAASFAAGAEVHDRPRADERPGPDLHSTEDHGPAADRRAATDLRRDHRPVGACLQAPVRRRSGKTVVDQHPVADEHLVLDLHAGADERGGGNLAAGADDRAPLDLHERPDPRPGPDPAAVEVHESRRGISTPSPSCTSSVMGMDVSRSLLFGRHSSRDGSR